MVYAMYSLPVRISVHGWRTYVTLPDETNPTQAGKRRRAGLVRLRLRMNNMLSGLASEKLNLQLISANWPITETEFVLIRIIGTILAFMLGMLVSRMVVSGIGLAVIVFFIPDLLLKRAISQRQMNFGKQLVDVLILMTGAVRAGYSLPQAIEVVSKELKATCFRRIPACAA